MKNIDDIICPNCKINKKLKPINKILLCKKCIESIEYLAKETFYR